MHSGVTEYQLSWSNSIYTRKISIHEHMYEHMHEDVWRHMYEHMYEYMYICMHECMHEYLHIWVCIQYNNQCEFMYVMRPVSRQLLMNFEILRTVYTFDPSISHLHLCNHVYVWVCMSIYEFIWLYIYV